MIIKEKILNKIDNYILQLKEDELLYLIIDFWFVVLVILSLICFFIGESNVSARLLEKLA